MSNQGWVGKTVRNADGREGRITAEWVGFCHTGLKIQVEGGGEAIVQLNTDGPDSGDAGWSWWHEGDGGSWYRLDDGEPPAA